MKNRTFFEKSFGVCYIEVKNANNMEARHIAEAMTKTAKHLNPNIQIEFHDSRLYYNEPKKIYQEID